MNDQELFSLCLWREARGEGVAGMRAVAWVIWNRSKQWNKSIHDVIMGPNQFSSMTVERNPPNPAPDDLQMAEAMTIVGDIQAGRDTLDPTKGSCYYANLAIVTSGWFKSAIMDNVSEHPVKAVIGNHTFFA